MTAGIIIDIVFSIIAALLILKYTLKGFVAAILDSAKGFVAVILAYLLRIPMAKLFDAWFMRDGIVEWVNNSIVASVEGNETFIDFVALYDKAPWFYNSFLTHFGLGDVSALDGMENASYEQIDAISFELGSAISYALSMALAIVVLFVIIYMALMIVAKMLGDMVSASSLGKINRILGFVWGVVVSFALVWVSSFVLELLSDVTGGFWGNLTRADLNESMLLSMVNAIL